jgi:acetoin utilization deacetylase AcuC-like enzyme
VLYKAMTGKNATLLDPKQVPYATTVRTFYRPEMAPPQRAGYSQSPQKPRLFMERGKQLGQSDWLDVDQDWQAFTAEDFSLAHEREYVDAFFAGQKPWAESNGLNWSRELADSVRYTNASLYEAICASVVNPTQIALSPTSGFHHASPAHGAGFCTFSGQVIAALKLYRETGMTGAFIDLDGHFGNSIEDSRAFCPDLDLALPAEYHINPQGKHREYLADLSNRLEILLEGLLARRVNYVVFCHGADSHVKDDLGGQLHTAEWLGAAEMVFKMVKNVTASIGHVSLALALFGGYRSDDYNAVLDLHWSSFQVGLQILADRPKTDLPALRFSSFSLGGYRE